MNRIKLLRESSGLTIQELSDITKISRTSLNNYENEKRTPRSKETWEKLADYFDVSVPYLMGYSDFKHSRSPKDLNDESWESLNKYDFGMISYDNFKDLYSETLIRASELGVSSDIFSNTIFSVINSLNLVISNEDDPTIFNPILDAFYNIQLQLLDLISMYSRDNQSIDSFIDNEMYTVKFLETKQNINQQLDTIFKKTFLEDLD